MLTRFNYPKVKSTLAPLKASTMDPFIEYVKHLKLSLPIDVVNVHLVIGNESCDLDSTVSSLALAYFSQRKVNDTSSIVLPVMNVPRDEFPIRTENVYVLNKIGIKPEQLIYRDDVDFKELNEQKKLQVSLVDHHVLSKNQEILKKKVIEIFDHRPLDKSSNWPANLKIKMLLVGSCSTLIANEIFIQDKSVLTSALAKILYETIIFDTIGLSQEAGKVKELDIKLCNQLEEYIGTKYNSKQLFDELWSAHNDVSKLTPKQLLSKDLKVLPHVLIPGLPMLVKEYLKLNNVLTEMEEFCKEKQCENMILMGLEAKGGVVVRDIAFYSLNTNSGILEKIIESLMEADELQLEEKPCGVVGVRYFRQHHKPSRKQILPMVKKVMEKLIDSLQLY